MRKVNIRYTLISVPKYQIKIQESTHLEPQKNVLTVRSQVEAITNIFRKRRGSSYSDIYMFSTLSFKQIWKNIPAFTPKPWIEAVRATG